MPENILHPSTTVYEAYRHPDQTYAWRESETGKFRAICFIVPANVRHTRFVVMLKIGDDFVPAYAEFDAPVYCVDEEEWNRLAE